jgi:hypothetical protein
MRGAIALLPQYALMTWCSVKAQGQLYLYHIIIVKVNSSLCLTKHHAMNAYWGVELQLHAFFDLGTKWR